VLLKGILLGLSIAAPIGPIGVLCIRRSLTDGLRVGFLCGLGAATADAVYAFIGSFAIAEVAHWLLRERAAFGVAGGVVLIYLGIRAFFSYSTFEPHADWRTDTSRWASDVYFTTFLLTLANPMTILSFAAIFAGVGLAPNPAAARFRSVEWLVLGVFGGSALWWLLLSAVSSRARRYLGGSALRVINGVCGLTLVGFGMHALATARPFGLTDSLP
jgi:threonine/homoserine/homoserine lactone efflux protein